MEPPVAAPVPVPVAVPVPVPVPSVQDAFFGGASRDPVTKGRKPPLHPKKSALKVQFAADTGTPKKSLTFKDELLDPEPQYLSIPLQYTDTVYKEAEQENFRQVWREVSSKKLHYAARVLQQFARKFMLCWIMTNDRRTELYEELDYVQERLAGDLERVEWEREDMWQQAKLEVEADDLDEAEDGGTERSAAEKPKSPTRINLELIKELQSEIRDLKADTVHMKAECKVLKKENKQLGYDLKEKAPPVEMAKHKVQNLEDNHKAIARNAQQYLPTIDKWNASVQQVNDQYQEQHRLATLYKDCVLNIWNTLTVQYPRKHLLKPVRDILKDEFVKVRQGQLELEESRGFSDLDMNSYFVFYCGLLCWIL
mgnify:CR=1 FL=1